MKISVSSECKRKSLFLFCCCFASWSVLTKLPLTSCQITTLMNENTTLLHPIININTTQAPASNNTFVYDLAYLKKLPWFCTYSNELEEVRILQKSRMFSQVYICHQQNESESECYCEGQNFLKIPQNLPNITRISIANSRFKVLTENGLRKYSFFLKDM